MSLWRPAVRVDEGIHGHLMKSGRCARVRVEQAQPAEAIGGMFVKNGHSLSWIEDGGWIDQVQMFLPERQA